MKPKPETIASLKAQLAQIDTLIKDGVLKGDAAKRAREELEAKVLAAVLGTQPSATAPAPRPLPRRLVLGVAGFVLAFAAAGYAWLGNHQGWAVGPGEPGDSAAAHAAGGAPKDEAQMAALTERLAARLKTQPEDAEGWTMLGRSYAAMGRHDEALKAYKTALDLRPKDAQAMADYADGLAMVNNRSLDGEPERMILQAVKTDPKNVKALALAGTAAFNRGEYKPAIDYWDRAIQASPPDSGIGRQLEGALAEARQRAGLPPVAAAVSAAETPALPAGAEAISGRVTLKDSLRGQVSPEDTLFVFARAAGGSRMPLAILRKKVSDLPLDFKLDDSQAMSPALRLSSARQVVVGARISKTGNAMPGPGDLQAISEPMALGTQGLKIEITEAVK